MNKEESHIKKVEQMKNLLNNYNNAKGYIDNNIDNISQEMLDNIEKKQKNRVLEMENFTDENK